MLLHTEEMRMSIEQMNAISVGHLPGLINFRVTGLEDGKLQAEMPIRSELMAPNGYLHAASVIALADTACGYGTFACLPEWAKGFTTIELKSNFLGTAKDGVLTCEAVRVHSGRTTQVWDATVKSDTGKTVALFRCTQIILQEK